MNTNALGHEWLLKRLRRVLLYAAVLIIVLETLGPFLWLIKSSVSFPHDLFKQPVQWLPSRITFSSYRRLLGLEGLPLGTPGAAAELKRTMGNTMIVSLMVTSLCLVLGCPAAYAFTRMRFKHKLSVLTTFLFTQMLPGMAIVIPLYLVINQLGLRNTLTSLVVTYTSFTLPFIVWILYGFFQTIPTDLEEAALIDGCTMLRAMVRVVLPLAAPGLVTAALFSFISAWNQFFFALIFTSTYRSKVVSVTISEFCTQSQVDWALSSTAGILASIPPLILCFLFQKYIVKGLMAGAVKG